MKTMILADSWVMRWVIIWDEEERGKVIEREVGIVDAVNVAHRRSNTSSFGFHHETSMPRFSLTWRLLRYVIHAVAST